MYILWERLFLWCQGQDNLSRSQFKAKMVLAGPFVFHKHILFILLTLSQTTNFNSKLKDFADDNFKFEENGRKLSKWVENTVGKGEIFPFPTVFSKDLYCKHVKTKACLGKG